jgi:hypothetical protein
MYTCITAPDSNCGGGFVEETEIELLLSSMVWGVVWGRLEWRFWVRSTAEANVGQCLGISEEENVWRAWAQELVSETRVWRSL